MGFSQTCTVYNQSIHFGHRPKGLWMQLDTPTASQHQLAHPQYNLGNNNNNLSVICKKRRSCASAFSEGHIFNLTVPASVFTIIDFDRSRLIFRPISAYLPSVVWGIHLACQSQACTALPWLPWQQVCECNTSRSSENCEEREGPFGSGLALWNSPFSPTAAFKAPTDTE